MAPPPIAHRWPPAAVLAVAGLCVLGLWGVLQLFDTLRLVAFMAFLGVVLATILAYPLDFFARLLPRSLAAFLTFLLVLGLVGGLGWLTLPRVADQAQQLIGGLPRALARLEAWWAAHSEEGPLSLLGGTAFTARLREHVSSALAEVLTSAVPIALGIMSLLAACLLVLVLAVFLAYQPEAYVRGLQRLVPTEREHVVQHVVQVMGASVREWAVGTLVAMAIMGVLTAGAMRVVGINSWLLIGVVGFFGEFIPYLGPLFALVVALAAAVSQAPSLALWAFVAHMTVHLTESHLIQPLVMKRALRIPPGVLLLWQLALTATFGFLGLLVATPLLGAVRAAVEYLYVERMLGKPPR